MSKRRPPFIAIGPGRCGTYSLAVITAMCKFVSCRHEPYRPVWGKPKTAAATIKNLLDADDEWLHGHSSHLILGVLPPIFKAIPNIRVVCLHRPKDATVASYMTFLKGNAQSFVKNAQPQEAKCYPAFDFPDAKKDAKAAFELWWETAEFMMDNIAEKQLPEEQVLHLQLRHLSDEESLNELYLFLGISPDHIRFPTRKGKPKFNWCRRRDGYVHSVS
jgi:hypothetical protein